MPLLLREADVHSLLTMPDAIAALDRAFHDWYEGHASITPRQRIVLAEQHTVLHMLGGAVPALDAIGFKAYTGNPSGVRFVVNLYQATTGKLQAIIEADWLGRMRTGAASGLATRYLARQDARRLGVIGAGGQAETQIMAIAAVRELELIRVYSRNQERLEGFCAQMASRLGIPVEPAPSAQEAVQDTLIVATATTAAQPILMGSWLLPGTHVNAMGSNWHNRREIDDEVVTRSAIVAADSVAQAKIEAGDLIIPALAGQFDWTRATELHAIVGGSHPGRSNPDDVTLFESLGIGLEDIAVAAKIYELATAQGKGEPISIFADLG